MMKPRQPGVYISPSAREFIDSVSESSGPATPVTSEIPAKKKTSYETRRSSYAVLMHLSKAQRNNIFDAVTEDIEDSAILDVYRKIIIDKVSLLTIPDHEVEAFFEDLEASSTAQDILLLGKSGAGRASTQTQRAVHPTGRMVPPKPSLSDYDMVRDLSVKHAPNFGVWHEDDDHGE